MAIPTIERLRREYRERTGFEDPRTDEVIIRQVGEEARSRGDFSLEQNDPAFRDAFLDLRREDAPSLGEEAAAGLRRGIESSLAAGAGVVRMGAESVGAEGLAEGAREFAQRRHEAAADAAPTIQRVEDVRGVGDAIRFATGMIPEQVPVVASTIAGGVVGELAAPMVPGSGLVAAGLTRSMAARALAQGMTQTAARNAAITGANQAIAVAGRTFGAAAPATGSYVGQIYNTARDMGADPAEARLGAFTGGIPAALVSIVYPARVAGIINRTGAGAASKSRIVNAAKEFGLGAGLEGSAEAVAEMFVIMGEQLSIPDYQITPEQYRSRVLNAAVAGGMVGGAIGAVTGAARSPQASPADTKPVSTWPTRVDDQTGETRPATVEEAVDEIHDMMSVAAETPDNIEGSVGVGRQLYNQARQTIAEGRPISPNLQLFVEKWPSMETELSAKATDMESGSSPVEQAAVAENEARRTLRETAEADPDIAAASNIEVTPTVSIINPEADGAAATGVQPQTAGTPQQQADAAAARTQIVRPNSNYRGAAIRMTDAGEVNVTITDVNQAVDGVDSFAIAESADPVLGTELRVVQPVGAPNTKTEPNVIAPNERLRPPAGKETSAPSQDAADSSQVTSRDQLDKGGINAAFQEMISTASRMGINIRLNRPDSQAADPRFAVDGGRYNPTNRTITVLMRDVLNPTADNALTLVHEVIHDIYQGLPQGTRNALHRWANRVVAEGGYVTDPRARYTRPDVDNPNGTEPNIFNEERTVDILAIEGVDRNEAGEIARGIIPELMRIIEALYLRAAIALQQTLFGEGAVSEGVATAYARNRVNTFLAGDTLATRSLMSYFGGEKPTNGEVIRRIGQTTGHKGITQYFSSIEGRWITDKSNGLSADSAFANIDNPMDDFQASLRVGGKDDALVFEPKVKAEMDNFRAEEGDRFRVEDGNMAARLSAPARLAIAQTKTATMVEVSVFNRLAEIVQSIVSVSAKTNPAITLESVYSAIGIDPFTETAAAAYNHGAEVINQTSGGQQTLGFDAGITIDALPTQGAINEANLMLAQRLNKLHDKINTKIGDQVKAKTKAEAQIDKSVDAFEALKKNISDIRTADASARLEIRNIVNTLRKHIEDQVDAAEAKGDAYGILREMSGMAETNGPITENVETLMNALNITEDTPIIQVIEALGNLEMRDGDGALVDITQATIPQIREAVLDYIRLSPPDNVVARYLEGLTRAGITQGSARLTALIVFMKRQAHIADAIRNQSMVTSQRAEISRQLQEIMETANEADLNRLVDSLRQAGLTGATEKVIVNFANAKKRMNAANRKIKEADEIIPVLTDAANQADMAMNEIARTLNLNFNWDFVDGAELFVPPDINATEDQVRANRRKIRMSAREGLPATTNQQLGEWQKAIRDWREVHRTDEIGKTAMWQWLGIVDKKIAGKLIHDSDLGSPKVGWMNNMLVDIATALDRSGTVSGKLAAQMFRNFTKITRSRESRTRQLGSRWDGVAGNAMRIINLPIDTFRHEVYDKTIHYLQRQSALEFEEGFQNALAVVRMNPQVNRAMSKQGAVAALRDLVRETGVNSEYFATIAKEMGIYVEEPSIERVNPLTGRKEKVLRDSLNRGVMTVSRVMRDSVKLALSSFYNSGMSTTANVSPFLQVVEKIEGGDVAAFIEQGRRVPASVRNDIIGPMLTDPLGSIIKAPAIDGGAMVPADINVVMEAWSAARGNVAQFALNMAAAQNVPLDQQAVYINSIMQTIYSRITALQSLNAEQSSNMKMLGTIKHVVMDARSALDMPAEFFEYDTFSANDNAFRLNGLAANAAFGRNMDALFRSMDSMEWELTSEAATYVTARQEAIGRNPDLAGNEKALRTQLRKDLGDDYQRLFDANVASFKGAYKAKAYKARVNAIFNPTAGLTGEVRLHMDILSGLVSMLTASPKTALKNFTTVFQDNYLLAGAISKDNILAPLNGLKLTVQFTAGSIATMFGANLLASNQRLQAMRDSGEFDHGARITSNQFRGDMGPGFSYKTDRGGTLRRGIRLAQNFFNNTTSPLTPEDTVLPTVRPNFFTWSQLMTNLIAGYQVIGSFETLINNVAKYVRANPDAVEVTAEQAGYADLKVAGMNVFDNKVYFNNMVRRLRENGIDFMALAREAIERQKRGEYLFSSDVVAAMVTIGRTEISLEASVTSRPQLFVTTELGRASGLLIGWPWGKSEKVVEMVRGTKGKRDLQASIAAAKALMFMMAPVAVVYSLFFDWYDEEVLGRKSNIRPLTGDLSSVEGAQQTVMSLVERMTMLGSFGFLGELPTSIVNLQQGEKVISFDERVVWANTLLNLERSIGNLIAIGPSNVNYANFWRPFISAVGGGAGLHYMQIANNLIGMDNEESRFNLRTNAQNYLRGAGRSLEMDVRVGGGGARPTPVTPYVADMGLAALSNDRATFLAKYEQAIQASMKHGDRTRDEAVRHIKSAFSSRHPLRIVFRTKLSEADYNKLLSTLSSAGQAAVKDASRLMDQYGEMIGNRPYFDSERRERERGRTQVASAAPRRASPDEIYRKSLENMLRPLY